MRKILKDSEACPTDTLRIIGNFSHQDGLSWPPRYRKIQTGGVCTPPV